MNTTSIPVANVRVIGPYHVEFEGYNFPLYDLTEIKIDKNFNIIEITCERKTTLIRGRVK